MSRLCGRTSPPGPNWLGQKPPKTIRLCNASFKTDIVRITEPCKVVITENICLQPNRSILYGPTPEQRERDPFVNTFGLFAGMVIEAEDVEVDMCGHTMSQAERFIQAQAFYYPIFLGSQVLPVPGEAFKPARRVLIHNGRIRNVGHFCIRNVASGRRAS
jgi:hypothetical protein